MPKVHADVVKDAAEFRYVVKGETPEVIADRVDVAASTIRRWARENDWDEAKRLRKTSPRAIANRLRGVIERILDECETGDRVPTPGEVDSLFKTSKMIERLDAETARATTALEVVDELSTFLQERCPHLIDELAGLLAEFAHEVIARVT